MANDYKDLFLDPMFDEMLDALELSEEKPKSAPVSMMDQKLTAIEEWIKCNGRIPSAESDDIQEKTYAWQLQSIQESMENSTEFDEMLDAVEIDESLYDFDHAVIRTAAERHEQDKKRADLARRKPVKDFSPYAPMFKQVQDDIDNKRRKVLPFSQRNVVEKGFYICGGLLCYIEKEYAPEINSWGKLDHRLHVVFANGTETNILYYSFLRSMWINGGSGRTVSEPIGSGIDDFELQSEKISNEKLSDPNIKVDGYIYILKSCSDEPEIKNFDGELYKVGYTANDVETRIQNAEHEPTYLCAPVKIVEKWGCQALNARKLEDFLHKFFAEAQIPIEVRHEGNTHVATEWFNVPLPVLERVIPLILNQEILHYRYDPVQRDIVRY